MVVTGLEATADGNWPEVKVVTAFVAPLITDTVLLSWLVM